MTTLTNIAPAVSRQKPVPAQEAAALAAELRRRIEGEVRFDEGARGLYATDASNYRQAPIGVVVPRSVEDVIETVAVCRQFGAPVLSRGGGTSLAGQCCNVAVVLDWSKYLNRVLEIDPQRRLARVEPGTVLDNLRSQAEKHHLTFGPDPATHTHCTLGGMLGNNSCGVHSQMSGKTAENTEALDVLTYDGLRLTVGWMDEAQLEAAIREGGRKGEMFARLKSLRERYTELIRRKFPRIPRRVSGYNLDELLPGPDGRFNLARALVGSEGTLVTILEPTLNLVPSPRHRALLVLGYADIFAAGEAVPDILRLSQPTGLEGVDQTIYENIRKKRLREQYLDLLPEGHGWLLVEFGGESRKEAQDKARDLLSRLGANGRFIPRLYEHVEDEEHVWGVRETALGATAFVPGEPTTWEGWEDSAVPPERVGEYMRELHALYDKFGYRGAMYGHFGQGCVHTRITFDLESPAGVRRFREFVEEAADLVVSYGGSLSGEHGDGQSRGELLVKMFGPELVEAFREFKQIWDPLGGMNPGKLVDAYKLDENLRLGGDYHPKPVFTWFQYPDDQGSFERAALRCVGVGKCRREAGKPGDDTMCPSYRVTREEMHSTRGRAHLLWEMMQGEAVRGGWRDEHVKEALDLCLACKGCKSDCPVNVDVATYKAEFFAHYYQGRLRPRSAYAFGLIDRWARLASLWPGLVNLATQTPGLSTLAKLAAHMPLERQIPAFAPETFRDWVKRRERRKAGGARVILWADTFNNYFLPQTAQAAYEVLEDAGFEVSVTRRHLCCGRPLYDFGMLGPAKRYLQDIMEALAPQIAAGIPIVVLEPSCASVFRDELRNLFPRDERADRLRRQTFLLAEFLEQYAPDYKLPQLDRKALVHGHCHHKSVLKFQSDLKVLERLGLDYQMLSSGCCGMAGSFGFEKEKYDVSVAAGEYLLLPAVRKAGISTLIIADGFSCREQIAQLTGRHALHLAEVIRLAQQSGPAGPGMYPEAESVRQREAAVHRSMQKTAFALAAAAGAAALLWQWRR